MSDGLTNAARMHDAAKREDEKLRAALAAEDPDGSKRRRVRDAFIELEAALGELPDRHVVQGLRQTIGLANDQFVLSVGTGV